MLPLATRTEGTHVAARLRSLGQARCSGLRSVSAWSALAAELFARRHGLVGSAPVDELLVFHRERILPVVLAADERLEVEVAVGLPTLHARDRPAAVGPLGLHHGGWCRRRSLGLGPARAGRVAGQPA